MYSGPSIRACFIIMVFVKSRQLNSLRSNCSFSPKQYEAVTVGSSRVLMTAENTLSLLYQLTACMNQVR